MADHPSWDYWQYEYLPDGRYIDVQYSGRDLGENDIRSREYDLDVKKWCGRKPFFWTAQEADLICFWRDPDKVERTDDDFILHDGVMGPRGDGDENGKKNIELREHITDLYDMIRAAQADGTLPPQLLRREMYIEWSERNGIDIPLPVLEALQAVEHENQPETQPDESSDDAASADLEHRSEKTGGSQQKRFENNLIKILAAILIHARLDKKDPAVLSNELEKILHNSAIKLNNKRLFLGDSTIEDRLVEARDLLK